MKPDPELAALDLRGLLQVCEAGFKRRFKGTALFRTGKGRLIRNIRASLDHLTPGD